MVVSIIVILLSILLPALRRTRETTRAISCGNNLKQIGNGICMYSNDYDEWMPISSPNAINNWKFEIAHYMGAKVNDAYDTSLGKGVFRCPSWKDKAGVGVAYQSGYGWNCGFSGNNFGYKESSATRGRVKITSVNVPTETIICGDTTDWYGSGSGWWDYCYMYHPSCSNPVVFPAPPVGNRHSKGICALWADFHVERKSQMELMNGVDGNNNWYYQRQK